MLQMYCDYFVDTAVEEPDRLYGVLYQSRLDTGAGRDGPANMAYQRVGVGTR